MPIPDYQTILLPLLKLTTDGEVHSLRESGEKLADVFGLSQEERKALLPSGRQTVFLNRLGWARTYLAKSGLVDVPKRGQFVISERGRMVIQENLPKITAKYLEQFSEFAEFINPSSDDVPGTAENVVNHDEVNPEEALELAYNQLRLETATELLEKVKACTPEFFEQLVVELLLAMGYGGSRKDAGETVGKSGDGGIDGIIKEDRLGLDVIYIQAKRWENTVSRPEIQKFAGALQGQRARKGVFITTADFSKEAKEFARNLESKVILIGGAELAQLMLDFNIGVSRKAVYEVKQIDSDYFEG